MIRYVFKEDEPLRIKAAGKADPQVIGEALAAITKDAGGRLTPSAVIDAARKDEHPLHAHFEWDDSAAAEAYRLEQARSIIRIVRVVDDNASDGTTRAFLSVKGDGRIAYRSIEEVRSSMDLQLAVLRQAERDLEAFERRYRDLHEVCEFVTVAREKLKARRRSMESRAAA